MTLSMLSYVDEGYPVFATVFESLLQAHRGRYVRDGCKVSASSTALAVVVSAGDVIYDGVSHHVSSATLTLAPADATKDRLDVIVWEFGVGLKVLTGNDWLVDSEGNYIPKTVRINDDQIPLAVVKVPAASGVVGKVYDVRCGSSDYHYYLKSDWIRAEWIYVSPDGGGSGSSPSSPTTLDDALTRLKSRWCSIVLADGTYHINKTYYVYGDHVVISSLSGDPSTVEIIFDSYSNGTYNIMNHITIADNCNLVFRNVTLSQSGKADATLPWNYEFSAAIRMDRSNIRGVGFWNCTINQVAPIFINAKHVFSHLTFVSDTINMSGDANVFLLIGFGASCVAWWDTTITAGYQFTDGVQGKNFLLSGTVSAISDTVTWFEKLDVNIVPDIDHGRTCGSISKRFTDVYGMRLHSWYGLRAHTEGCSPRSTVFDAYKVYHGAGLTSDFILALQDGNGRVHWYWNATPGTHTYIVGGEDAGWIRFTPNWVYVFRVYYGDGSAAAAGDTVSWQELFRIVNDKSIYTGSHYPFVDNAFNLGSSTLRWASVYGVALHSRNIRLHGDGTNGYLYSWPVDDTNRKLYLGARRYTGTGGTTDYVILDPGGHLRPFIDNVQNLGLSTSRWANIYAVNLYVGDIVLDNGWRVSEYDDSGEMLDGVRILSKDGREIFRVDETGVWFKGKKVCGD